MNPQQISLQLWTLRPRLTTPADFVAGIKRLADIGLKSVQLSHGPEEEVIAGPELLKLCNDHGISIDSAHESTDTFDNRQKAIDRLLALGIKETAYAYPAFVDFSSESAISEWLGKLEEAKHDYAAAGINFSYHNHHMEFIRVGGGKTVMERVFSETTLTGEVDVHWIAEGGASPLEWVKRYAEAGRLPMIHLKDRRIAFNPAAAEFDIFNRYQRQFAEIGSGTIDFAPIIAAAEAGGCKLFIIEQDSTHGRDEFEAVAESFRYLTEHFVK